MQKEIQLTDKTLLVVGLEENHICSTSYMGYLISKYHNLDNGVTEKQLANPILLDKYLAKHNTENDFKETAVKLPKGNYELLGIYPELTEEQASSVIEKHKVAKDNYRDFTKTYFNSEWLWTCKTALESFKSLMEREKCYTVNPLKFDPTGITTGEWQEAQQTTFDKYAILIKSK